MICHIKPFQVLNTTLQQYTRIQTYIVSSIVIYKSCGYRNTNIENARIVSVYFLLFFIFIFLFFFIYLFFFLGGGLLEKGEGGTLIL